MLVLLVDQDEGLGELALALVLLVVLQLQLDCVLRDEVRRLVRHLGDLPPLRVLLAAEVAVGLELAQSHH